MREVEIKAAILNALRGEGAVTDAAIIASEYPLFGSRVRADLAILSTQFIGIEVKSKRDSLRRLAPQMKAYVERFDRVVLAVASSHVQPCIAMNMVGVEVWEVTDWGALYQHISPGFPTPAVRYVMTPTEEKRFRRESELDGKAQFVATFSRRYGATSDRFWRQVLHRPVRSDDIFLLSRHHKRRLINLELRRKRERLYEQWADC